jgi:hypothetical protein
MGQGEIMLISSKKSLNLWRSSTRSHSATKDEPSTGRLITWQGVLCMKNKVVESGF